MRLTCSKMWMKLSPLSMIDNNQLKLREVKLILILQKWKVSSRKNKRLTKIMRKLRKNNNMRIVWWMKSNTPISSIAFSLQIIPMILKMKISEWFISINFSSFIISIISCTIIPDESAQPNPNCWRNWSKATPPSQRSLLVFFWRRGKNGRGTKILPPCSYRSPPLPLTFHQQFPPVEWQYHFCCCQGSSSHLDSAL